MPAAPVHHTPVDKTGAWDGPAAEKAFDKKAGDFVKFYAYVDTTGDADGSDKEDGWGPHHDIGGGGVPGDANLKGVESAMAALNGAHGSGSMVPDSARQAVWDHLAAHYEDAGIDKADIPELKSGAPMQAPVRKPRSRRELARQPEYRMFEVPQVEVRAGTGANDGLVEVAGMVIRYDTPYEVYDMFGSFTETIHYGAAAPVLAANPDVRFLVNHTNMPLARTGAEASLILEDSPEGLLVRALIDPRQSAANDLIVALERGTVNQMSVGMEVDPTGDIWAGEDDWGMPNERDIFRLANIFDTSAVTFPASPTTTLELAQRQWAAVPVASRERTRQLWELAREGRQGTLTQRDSDTLLHVLEDLYNVDTQGESRAEPTATDKKVTALIPKAIAAVHDVMQAQMTDPDNGHDPVDEDVVNHLTAAHASLVKAAKSQGVDNAPNDPPTPPAEVASATPQANGDGVYQADPDGTNVSGDGNAPGIGNPDGTGSRSLDIEIEMELLRLAHRPVSV